MITHRFFLLVTTALIVCDAACTDNNVSAPDATVGISNDELTNQLMAGGLPYQSEGIPIECIDAIGNYQKDLLINESVVKSINAFNLNKISSLTSAQKFESIWSSNDCYKSVKISATDAASILFVEVYKHSCVQHHIINVTDKQVKQLSIAAAAGDQKAANLNLLIGFCNAIVKFNDQQDTPL